MLKNLAVRAGLAVLGVVVMLAWWSFTGDGSNTETFTRIPDKIFDGGTDTLEFEVEVSHDTRLNIMGSEESGDEEAETRSFEASEVVKAGRHTWRISIPGNISAFFDATVEKPEIGASVKWWIRVNGRVVDEQAETLTEPLRSGYAFGLVAEFANIARGEVEP